MEMNNVRDLAQRFGGSALRSSGGRSSSSAVYEKVYSTTKSATSGSLEALQNSHNYHEESHIGGETKAIGGYTTSGGTYSSSYSTSRASPIRHSHSYTKEISHTNGSVSPSYVTGHYTSNTAHQTVHSNITEEDVRRLRSLEWSTYFKSDSEATAMMMNLNNKLSQYKMDVLVYQGNNRRLEEELKRLQMPMAAFDNLEREIMMLSKKKIVVEEDHRLHAEYARYKEEGERMRVQYASVEKARLDQIAQIDMLIKQIADLEAHIGLFRAQKIEFDERYQHALADNDMLATDLKRARSELEREKQERARFEAQLHSMESETRDYSLDIQSLKQKVMEFTSTAHTEIIQSDLKEAVERIRNEYEASRRTLVLDFDAQISKFRAHWLEESKEAERLCLEVADVRAQSERIGIIERENQGLLAKMSDLERMVAAERARYKAMQEKYSHDTKHWAELKQMLLSEEHELIDRSKLYGEVVIYRDILESKAHFDMSAAATVMTTQSTHSEKMHSFQNQSSGKVFGSVAISLVDAEGRFITLKNMTSSDVMLHGWQIKQWKGSRDHHGGQDIKIMLPDIVIAANSKFQIWASGHGHGDSRPNYVASQISQWCLRNSVTHLIDNMDKLQATYNRVCDSEDEEYIVG